MRNLGVWQNQSTQIAHILQKPHCAIWAIRGLLIQPQNHDIAHNPHIAQITRAAKDKGSCIVRHSSMAFREYVFMIQRRN